MQAAVDEGAEVRGSRGRKSSKKSTSEAEEMGAPVPTSFRPLRRSNVLPHSVMEPQEVELVRSLVCLQLAIERLAPPVVR